MRRREFLRTVLTSLCATGFGTFALATGQVTCPVSVEKIDTERDEAIQNIIAVWERIYGDPVAMEKKVLAGLSQRNETPPDTRPSGSDVEWTCPCGKCSKTIFVTAYCHPDYPCIFECDECGFTFDVDRNLVKQGRSTFTADK
jgi:hypothetical protein